MTFNNQDEMIGNGVNLNSPVMLNGTVKIRTHLLFKKKKFIYVQENGRLVISKKKGGKIED